MATADQIAADFAQRLRDGLETLRDAEGQQAALVVPLSDDTDVELGLNPQGGPYLRLLHRTDRLDEAARTARVAGLVRLTAAARFGAGWVGGCASDTVLTLARPVASGAEAPRIAAMIRGGDAVLREGRGAAAASGPAPAPEPEIGADWLRL